MKEKLGCAVFAALFACLGVARWAAAQSLRPLTFEEALERPGDVTSISINSPVRPEIERLVELRFLSVRGALPARPIRLPKLETLWVELGANAALPDWVGDLNGLRTLVISGPISALPASLARLSELTEVSFDHTELVELPRWIGRWKKLRKLTIIESHKFQALPDALGQLEALEELVVRTCALKTFPANVDDLKELRQLRLDKNALTDLPWAQLGALPALENVDVFDNPLIAPESVGALSGNGTYLSRPMGADGKPRGPILAVAPAEPPPGDPRLLRRRLLAFLASDDRARARGLARAAKLVSVADEETSEIFTKDAVGVDVFVKNLFDLPGEKRPVPEAVLQLRAHHFYVLALFVRTKDGWTGPVGTSTQDLREVGLTEDIHFAFSFAPVGGRSLICGVTKRWNLGGNDRSESGKLVILRGTPSGFETVTEQDLGTFGYRSTEPDKTSGATATFKVDSKRPKPVLILRWSRAGRKKQGWTEEIELQLDGN